MAELGPPDVIAGPGISPFPTGLEITATVITHGADDYRWGNRIAFTPESCNDPLELDPCDTTTSRDTAANRLAKVEYQPFIVVAYDRCSTFGFETADYEQRALNALSARESKGLEKEFWTGAVFAANAALARAIAPTNGGIAATTIAGVFSLQAGLASLVQYLATNNGGKGMIHMRPFLAELLASEQAIVDDGPSKLRTRTGIPVVAGSGYPGTSPAGAAITATSEWMFASDNVVVHRGPVEVFAPGINGMTVDRAANNVIVRAQRLVAPIFNGCALAAVNVNPALTL